MKKIHIEYDELYKKYIIDGLSRTNIAKEFNCSVDLIAKKLFEFSIKKRKKTTDELYKINKEELENLYIVKKYTIKQLSIKFNVSLLTIQRLLIENNIPIRNRSEDIIGKKYTKLTVMSFYDNVVVGGILRERYLCQCDCGNTKKCVKNRLTEGRNLSCGCIKSVGESNSKWRGYKEISGTYFSSIINGAKSRNLECNIKIEEIWNLFIKQDKKCALSGEKLIFSPKTEGVSRAFGTASLDRIDSSKGYTINNVQWVHKDINYMKMDLRQDRFIELCNKVTKNIGSKHG